MNRIGRAKGGLAGPKPTSVLIVGGGPEDRIALGRVLSGAGHECCIRFEIAESANGADGLAAWPLRKPDCLLLDEHLPDMDTTEFLSRLKELAGVAAVPVVLLAGSENRSIAPGVPGAGAQEYLPKRLIGSQSLLGAMRSAQQRCRVQANPRRMQTEHASRDVRLHDAEARSVARLPDPISARMMQVSAAGLSAGLSESAPGPVMICRDVADRRRLNREIAHRATHDPLTGLANRELFENRVRQLLEAIVDDTTRHALFVLDLDQFKRINESCGHAGGDQFLCRLATLLCDLSRPQDIVARLGGDEFGIIMPHCGAEQAERIGREICHAIDEFRFIHDDKRFRVGVRIGMVSFDHHWKNHNELLGAADCACYAAKAAGRDRVYVWRDDDAAINSRRSDMVWHQSLESAIDEGRFDLFGQRIEDIDDSTRPAQLEVLLRLRQPDGSLIRPGAFFPTAERFHLAVRIDRWVVGEVFDQMNRLGSLGPGIASLAVNLSGQSIADKEFQADIQIMLADARFDVGIICFEITETAAITDLYGARGFINAVRQFGVKVVLDDFGAGACSFNYLKTLQVDAIKIDGHLIGGLTEDSVNVAAVRCFRDVAEVLGLGCVAEFVESVAVLDAVRCLGISMAQGYLLHRPEPLWPLVRRSASPRVLARQQRRIS